MFEKLVNFNWKADKETLMNRILNFLLLYFLQKLVLSFQKPEFKRL